MQSELGVSEAMDGMRMGAVVARPRRRGCLTLLVAAMACWWWCAGRNTYTCVAAARTARAVNLGGWLVVEGWIKPSPFDDIPNDVLLDGTQIFLKSTSKNAYWSATGGGGGAVVVGKQTKASSWETFRIWRRPGATGSNKFRLRVLGGAGQFVGIGKDGRTVVAAETGPAINADDFEVIANANGSKVRIKAPNGRFLQATGTADALTADYGSESTSWDDTDPSVFLMTVHKRMTGEFQLCNYYGLDRAATILKQHWETFIREEDFNYISTQGLNAVRIPVAWWITVQEAGSQEGTNCRSPFYPDYLEMLDKAFDWADKHNLGVILDLHAAPGSQNGNDNSASRDGSVQWPTDANIQRTVAAIGSLAERYSSRESLLAIELLNEPSARIPLQTLGSYYSAGYRAVREHTEDAYVIMSARLSSHPQEILGVIANGGFRRHVVDVHYYNLYDKTFDSMTLRDNIRYVRDKRLAELRGMERAAGPPVLVGEWAAEWANKPRGGASDDDYARFAQAQLDVFGNASFGWAYWTYRNDAGGALGWSLKEMMQRGIVSFARR